MCGKTLSSYENLKKQTAVPGLPDGIFSNQNSKFWINFWVSECIMEDVGIFYGHLVYFTDFGFFYGYLVYISPFWYVVQRKIWQPCQRQWLSCVNFGLCCRFFLDFILLKTVFVLLCHSGCSVLINHFFQERFNFIFRTRNTDFVEHFKNSYV
jgi:hypothetical protein